MEVDQNNLMKALELIENKLEKCEFVSIHLLSTNRIEDRIHGNFFKNPGTFYLNCLETLKEFPFDFQPIEIGLIIWRKDNEGDTTYQAFNFPIFPNPSTLLPMRKRNKFFTLDGNIISNLLERDFQFNNWIKDSLSHLTIYESDIAKTKLEENKNEVTKINLHGDDKIFIEDMTKKMEEFLSRKDQTNFRFPPCNAWKRRLIYQTFKAEPYSKSTFLQTCKQQRDVVIVNKLSEAEVKRRLDEYFNKQIGFLSVFKLLIHSQKPIIGFRLFSDLLIYYKTFWTFPPEALEEFKEIFRSLFPCIIDVHRLAEGHFKNDSLEELFLTLNTKYTTLSIAKQLTSDSKAFKVGCSFIKLLNYFHKQQNSNQAFDISNIQSIIERFQNQISLPTNHDLKMVDFSNDDSLPNRDQLRIVRIIAEEGYLEFEDWLNNENNQIISRFSDSDLLIKLQNETILDEKLNKIFQILSLEEYFNEQEKFEKEKIGLLENDQQESQEVEDEMSSTFEIDGYGEMKLPKDDDIDVDGEMNIQENKFNEESSCENCEEENIEKNISIVDKESEEESNAKLENSLKRSTILDKYDDDPNSKEIQNKKVKKTKTKDDLFDENFDWSLSS